MLRLPELHFRYLVYLYRSRGLTHLVIRHFPVPSLPPLLAGSEKNEKRMRYKDVVREQILQANTAEDVISSDDESDDGGGGERNRRNGLAYDEEQERLRKSLLGSIAEHGSGSDSGSDDDGDGLLKVLDSAVPLRHVLFLRFIVITPPYAGLWRC